MTKLNAVADTPWICRAGRWVTKRRSVILAPLFVVAVVAARAAAVWWMETAQDLFGIACLVGGTWLRLAASRYHGSGHGASPITAGPYAWIQHPIYLANFLLGLGIVVLAGWWPMTVVYGLIFFPMHVMIMRAEEVHLRQLYGPAYVAYCRAVPAIIPWRRYAGPRTGQRNEFKMQRGQERLKVLGYAVGVAVLLSFKYWRRGLGVVTLPPLSMTTGAVLAAVALLAVIYRGDTRWAWVRVAQTLLVVACVLLLAVSLPGVWPPRGSAPTVGPRF